MKTKTTARLARLLAIVAVVCMLACSMSITAFATGEKVNQCANGVLQVNLVYTDDNNVAEKVATGTGFLVNDTTLVTCYHVVTLTESELQALATIVGKTTKDVQNRLSISVTVSRDLTIPATYVNGSAEVDFAIIKMNQTLTKTPLTLRKTDALKQTDKVWTLGFPIIDDDQTIRTFTEEDVNITGGTVTKIADGENIYSGKSTHYIQTDCNMDFGNSGGPMVDENGYVVGISQGMKRPGSTEYYHAIAIDQVITVLETLGITFTLAGDTAASEATTTVASEEAETTTTEGDAAAQTTMPTLPSMDTSSKDSGSGMMWILIVAAVVVVVIIVVVVIVISGGNKKSTPPTTGGFTPPAPPSAIPPVQPVTPPSGRPSDAFSAPPTFPVQNAGETTVLGGGNAGETTVLSRNAVNGGTLVRKSNGASININAEQFVIGRDRKTVNFCISDNSSISRNHVKINVRGGVAYLTDLGAANGTFVNGAKAMPRQEIALKNGDKVTLADEDFEYKL